MHAVPAVFRHLLPLFCLLPFTGCLQVAYTVGGKQIAPEVRAMGREPGSWYAYLPQRDPGFCLITRRAVVWFDPQMNLGHWRAKLRKPPYRVLMEARGNTFVLHRRYVWDGRSWGCTHAEDLLPTLLHDSLYQALLAGAPFPRSEADNAYLRAEKRSKIRITAYREYAAVRVFGALFNRLGNAEGLTIEPLPPATPLSPLEPDRPEPLAGEEEPSPCPPLQAETDFCK